MEARDMLGKQQPIQARLIHTFLRIEEPQISWVAASDSLVQPQIMEGQVCWALAGRTQEGRVT